MNHYDNFLPGVLYGYSMFAVGFALGVLRTLLVTPLIMMGSALAAVVFFELPIIVPICYVLSAKYLRWSSRDHWNPGASLTMSITAFATLMLLEVGMCIVLFRQPTDVVWHEMTKTPKGVVGLLGQLLCSGFPIIQQLRLQQQQTMKEIQTRHCHNTNPCKKQ